MYSYTVDISLNHLLCFSWWNARRTSGGHLWKALKCISQFHLSFFFAANPAVSHLEEYMYRNTAKWSHNVNWDKHSLFKAINIWGLLFTGALPSPYRYYLREIRCRGHKEPGYGQNERIRSRDLKIRWQ